MIKDILKVPCYSGSFFSGLIAMQLFKMGPIRELTFLNKMFFIYFTIESVVGWVDGNFLFRLLDER